jgi:hypothetical protein
MSTPNQPQPGTTLLQTWITSINQANFEYLSGNFQQSWQTYKILFIWLPLNCKEDCRKLKDEIENQVKIFSTGVGFNYAKAQTGITNKINHYLFERIPEFAELVESSLETGGWLHKEGMNVAPRSGYQPHIGE